MRIAGSAITIYAIAVAQIQRHNIYVWHEAREGERKYVSHPKKNFTNGLVHMRTCRLEKQQQQQQHVFIVNRLFQPNRFQLNEIELVCYLPISILHSLSLCPSVSFLLILLIMLAPLSRSTQCVCVGHINMRMHKQ